MQVAAFYAVIGFSALAFYLLLVTVFPVSSEYKAPLDHRALPVGHLRLADGSVGRVISPRKGVQCIILAQGVGCYRYIEIETPEQ